MSNQNDSLHKGMNADGRELGGGFPEVGSGAPAGGAEALLRARERQSSAILDAASESIWLMTLEGDILNANATAAKRLGMEVRDLVGKNCFDFLYPEVARLRKEKIKEMVEADGPIRFEDERSGIYFDHNFFPVRDETGKINGLAIFSRDVTERKLAEKSLMRSNERFEILAYTAQELLLSRKPQEFVESLYRMVMEHLDCRVFFNFLVDEKAGKLHLNVSAGIPAEEAKRIEWLDFGTSVCGCVASDGCRIVAEHIPSTPDVRTDLVKSYGIKAYACHPLLSEDRKVIGTLSFGTDTRETFSYEDLTMMKAVADQVAVAMIRVSNEEALRQSETRFRAIAEASPVGIGVISVPESKFLYVNMSYIKSFGYAEADLIGQGTPQIYWSIDDREKILDLLKKNGSVADYEVRLKRKNGAPFWALSSVRPITYGGRQALLAAFVDITERKRTEEKVVRLNRTLAALGKSSQAMMRAANEEEYLRQVCDIIVKECGYKMTWIGIANNDRDKTVTPAASAGFEGGYLEALNVTWADTERGKGPTGTAIRTGEVSRSRNISADPVFVPWRSEAVKRGYASSIVLPLMGRERVFGALNIYSSEPDPFLQEEEQLLMELAHDLSQGLIALRLREARNRAEELLRAERNFSNAVVQTTGGLIVGLDAAGRVQLFNHACEKTTGYTFNEIKGRAFWDFLLIPEEREPVKKLFERIKNGASSEMEYESYWVAKGGARRYIKWANSAIRNNDGGVRLIIGTGIDITERLQADTELKKQAVELKMINDDLTLFNNAAVNRELRMVELKKELNGACVRLGEAPRYPLVIDEDDDTKVLDWVRNRGAVGTTPVDNGRTL